MRLLNSKSLQFEVFFDAQRPKYAILSHRWEDGEIPFQTFRDGQGKRLQGYRKILRLCELARSRGFEWVWVDTCCINQDSSAELSEAINAMYKWYSRAEVCFAYLSDVDDVANLKDSKWFQRGWTLQELIAPQIVEFYNKSWRSLGTRHELFKQVAEVTNIDFSLLQDVIPKPEEPSRRMRLAQCSMAEKMSWVSKRQTSRDEDIAYCMLGLCGVNMPLLYGEGFGKAFHRLQKEILATSPDESIFAWAQLNKPIGRGSILATLPIQFEGCGNVRSGWIPRLDNFTFEDPEALASRKPYRITNKGLRMHVHLIKLPPSVPNYLRNEHCVPINCSFRLSPSPFPVLLRICPWNAMTKVDEKTHWRVMSSPITVTWSEWQKIFADPDTGVMRRLSDIPMQKIYICAD